MIVIDFLIHVLLLQLHLCGRGGLDWLLRKFMSIICIQSPLDGWKFSLHVTYKSSLFGGLVSRLGLPCTGSLTFVTFGGTLTFLHLYGLRCCCVFLYSTPSGVLIR